MSNFIVKYEITKHKSDLISLVFTTITSNFYIVSLSNTNYIFIKKDLDEEKVFGEIEIKKFLPKDTYIRFIDYEKNQIHVLFVPIGMIDHKEDKTKVYENI